MKNIGILLPIASLPSSTGIGDFGIEAYRFVDYLEKHGYKYWQLLPLNPLGPGYSPYLTTCSSAIDFRYISLEVLTRKKYLKREIKPFPKSDKVLFYEAGELKEKELRKAYKNYMKTSKSGLEKFRIKNPWVVHYATFTIFKNLNGGRPWNEWPLEQRDYFKHHTHCPKTYLDEIHFEVFKQYIAYSQFNKLKAYAHKHGVKIIGDIPFYVGYDSVDCWLNQEQFDLDENLNPRKVGGVPPDYFSKTGQLWGNPCYNFEHMKEDGYNFLINRIKNAMKTCDILRLDHFRAFYDYYAIDFNRPDATIGEWKMGPADDFFNALYKKLPNVKLIAEDLGELSPGVLELRDRLNLPGMNVIQFSILDDNFKDNGNLVVYSGTHDNDTLRGWLNSLEGWQRDKLGYILQKEPNFDNLMEYIKNKPSYITIISMVDILGLDTSARLNVPGTVGSPNFEWKMTTRVK